MDSDSLASLLGIALLVLCSAFFSATETAFSSINRVRLKNMADNGSKRAALVLRLHSDYDKLLSTILVGNNIVNIAMASMATLLFVQYFGGAGASLSTLVTTVVVLIFGEISPKSLAKESPEKFAMFSAPIVQVLVTMLTPVNWFFTQWKKLLSKLFKSSEDKAITEEELLTIIEEAEHEGAINEEDKELIHSVMDFNDSKASDILTPRVDIVGISKEASTAEIEEAFVQTRYSRIPVYDKTIDNIVGVIHIKDFFELKLKDRSIKDQTIASILSPVIFVTPHLKISTLLKKLQTEKCHLAVVTDEYGGTVGMVTMEDILEELVGEIWDEHDEIIQEFTPLEDGTYKIVCSAPIDEMLSFFDLTGEVDSTTVSGWVVEQLGAIPKVGDSFTYEALFVTVTKTDHRRVLEIVVAKEKDADTLPVAE